MKAKKREITWPEHKTLSCQHTGCCEKSLPCQHRVWDSILRAMKNDCFLSADLDPDQWTHAAALSGVYSPLQRFNISSNKMYNT